MVTLNGYPCQIFNLYTILAFWGRVAESEIPNTPAPHPTVFFITLAAMTPLYIVTMVFLALLCVSGFFYAGLVLRMFRAFGKMKKGDAEFEKLPSVSVLVSARNEEANIETLVNTMLKQDYQGEWDLWIADDRSTDNTLTILRECQKKFPGKLNILPITEIPKGASPKKQAISKLVAASKGELLLLTDADCRIPSTWISGIVREFKPGIDFVAGHSYIELNEKSSPLLYMQAVETMSYRIAGTAGLALHMPLTSTGNNLSYRRTFFEGVHGFENVTHIQSGDDDLLMQKAANKPSCMHYCIAEETFIATDGKETLKGLWEQRKRWASKTIHYTPRTLSVLGTIFLFFLCLTLSPLMAMLDLRVTAIVGAMFLLKVLADLLLFRRGLKVFKQEFLFKWFIPVEILHAPFTVLAVLFGVLGKFQWKN